MKILTASNTTNWLDKIQITSSEVFDGEKFNQVLQALNTKYGGELHIGQSLLESSLTIMDEAMGTKWIQVYVSGFEKVIFVEQYFDSELLQNEYGRKVKIPWTDVNEAIEAISRVIDEMRAG